MKLSIFVLLKPVEEFFFFFQNETIDYSYFLQLENAIYLLYCL